MTDINKIFVDLAVNLATSTIESIWGFVKRKKNDLTTLHKIDSEKIFKEYILTLVENYGKVRTLIRREPYNIHECYVAMDIKFSDNSVINSSDFCSIFAKSSKVIISGTGGIGKTFLMRSLIVDSIKKGLKIPIYIELKNMQDARDIIQFENQIYENVKSSGLKIEEKFFQGVLAKGKFLILFDGFDEVKKDNRDMVGENILSLSRKYSSNFWVVSSRPAQQFLGWPGFDEAKILPLTETQAIQLIRTFPIQEETKRDFIEKFTLNSKVIQDFNSFREIPLLLTIMLLTFESTASIPGTMEEFYDNAFSALYQRHDATKGNFTRERRSGLNFTTFRDVFSDICYTSYFTEVFQFSYGELLEQIRTSKMKKAPDRLNLHEEDILFDLKEAVCMITKEGLNYKYTHRAFQEYFAAFALNNSNDSQIKEILVWWFDSGHNFESENTFWNCLKIMQKDRFYRNLYIPVIKRIKTLCDKESYFEFLRNEHIELMFYKENQDIAQFSGAHIVLVNRTLELSILRQILPLEDFLKSDPVNMKKFVSKYNTIYPEVEKYEDYARLDYSSFPNVELNDLFKTWITTVGENIVQEALLWTKDFIMKSKNSGVDSLKTIREKKLKCQEPYLDE